MVSECFIHLMVQYMRGNGLMTYNMGKVFGLIPKKLQSKQFGETEKLLLNLLSFPDGKIITKPSVLPRTATKPTLEKIELPIAPELPNTTQVKTETKEKISLSNPSNSIRPRKEVSSDNANAPPSENLWGAKEIGLKEPIKQVIEQPTPSASSPKEQPTSKIALVEQAQLNANPLPGSPQLNSGSSNIWTGTVSEAEDQFDTNLINGIDTVSDSKSKQPFSGKMQILNLNGNLIGEVNLLDGQLHGEEVFIDESGVITERNLWEKGVRIQ